MAKKRFTDIEIWDKEWYMDLTPTHKCLIKYIFDKCDASGCWKPNWRLASLHINDSVKLSDLSILPKDQYEILENGKIFIPDFVKFQYGKLSKECRPHIPIIALIEKNNLSERFVELIENRGSSVKALRKRLTDQYKKEIIEQDDHQCQYCGNRAGTENLIVEHIVALSNGGDNSDANLTTACKSCNSKKHDDDVFEFLIKHKLTPLDSLSKKLNTLSKKLNTLEEEEEEKDKEEEEDMDMEEEEEKDKEIFIVPEMQKIWKKSKPDYPDDIVKDSTALYSLSIFISEKAGVKSPTKNKNDLQSILKLWEVISAFVSGHNFYKNYSLYQVDKHIQSITQEIKNGKSDTKNGKSGVGKINGQQLNEAFTKFYTNSQPN
ncbi:MAG: HNH endonuclease signature motif containing protein [Ferruginibacter sp.]